MLLGPEGGDARSLAYNPSDPNNVFLGTSTGTLFVSGDAGRSWVRFAHLGGDNYVLDHIVIDSRHPEIMFVSAWNIDDQTHGDVFRSRDGGKSWVPLPDMHGKSVRTLAMAFSNPNVIVSGTLDGVYRSNDGGDSWQRISPASLTEIKNVESIAIGPKDPNLIYAGTWHLPWKTSDGGVTWHQINHGMIDDSDVFSILIDPTDPSVVFVSACSGIYKSNNAGEIFQKLQGIPFSARRTRVLKQDPTNPKVVYAGTTQGLWKTIDSGKTWKEMTNPGIVVNDILVDPRNSSRLLLATDRGGVMLSNNGGLTISPSNRGYTHRYVTAILGDIENNGRIFVAIANDREWGGVFSLHDKAWQQTSSGLDGRDVFALTQAANGALIAGTNRGIFVLDRNSARWRPGIILKTERPGLSPTNRNVKASPTSAALSLMRTKVNDIQIVAGRWLVASSAGIFTSSDDGRSWEGGPVLGRTDFVSAQSRGGIQVAATHTEILISVDEGANWRVIHLPVQINSTRNLALTPEGNILVASREGGFRTSDAGETWEHMLNGLPDRDLSSISYDESARVLLVTSLATGVVFSSNDGGRSWLAGADLGYPLRQVSAVHGHLLAATFFDGVIAEQ